MPESSFNKVAGKSRAKMYGSSNPILKMPDCDTVVKNAFLSCGCALNGGMGLIPLTWSELDAYVRRSKVDLSAWESDHVIMMSREYCAFIQKAKSETCVQPYWPDMSKKEQREYYKSVSRITEESELQRDSNGNVLD